MDMIQITPDISIDEREIQFEFHRASGPGGQRVNKVSTAVMLRFNVMASKSLPEDLRHRLKSIAGKRMTEEGVLVINARRYRSQDRNRQDALNRLVELIRKAAEKPKPRRRTKPTQAAQERRLDEKRHRSRIKRMRQHRPPQDE